MESWMGNLGISQEKITALETKTYKGGIEGFITAENIPAGIAGTARGLYGKYMNLAAIEAVGLTEKGGDQAGRTGVLSRNIRAFGSLLKELGFEGPQQMQNFLDMCSFLASCKKAGDGASMPVSIVGKENIPVDVKSMP